MSILSKFIKKRSKKSDDSKQDPPTSEYAPYDFKFLDRAIRQLNKISLDRDVVLGPYEEEEYSKGINIEGKNLVIDGCGHSIDARGRTGIFNIARSASNITIKNITFKNARSSIGSAINNFSIEPLIFENLTFINNVSMERGGAVNNLGILKIIGCEFIENAAQTEGGGICNWGDIHLKDCRFIENRSEFGGAVSNHQTMAMEDNFFSKNSARSGGAVNNEGIMQINTSEFIENTCRQNGGAILTEHECLINNSVFEQNSSEGVGGAIKNAPNKHLAISNTVFKRNIASESGGAISNDGQSNVDSTVFKDNHSSERAGAIENDVRGILISLNNIFEGNSSSEGGAVYTVDDDAAECKYCEFTQNQPEDYPKSNAFAIEDDFTYLDRLIHSGEKTIVLDRDITIKKREEADYASGIPVDVDGITIDGAGHAIDGDSIARIFRISANDIAIKNITLKRGSSDAGGGIYVEEDSSFELNNSTIIDCKSYVFETGMFANNGKGAAVYNSGGSIRIIDSKIIKNNSDVGGAIYTDSGKIKIMNTEFCKNTSYKMEGGAISSHETSMEIHGSDFSRNTSQTVGGAIFSDTKLRIESTRFTQNRSKRHGGGAIANWKNGEIYIKACDFTSNESENDGEAIKNMDSTFVTVINSKFKNHTSTISNDGEIELRQCTFTEKSNISNSHSGVMKLVYSQFMENTSDGEIISNEGHLKFIESEFSKNDAELLISNLKDGMLVVSKGEFEGNTLSKSMILNESEYCEISSSTVFRNNASEMDIVNRGHLLIGKVSFEDSGKTILNEGNVELNEQASRSIVESIENSGEIILNETEDIHEPSAERGFSYLNDLIHESEDSNILLTEDIMLKHEEMAFFEGGIELDTDGLVIDGDGHTIDAAEGSRIFIITAENVTLKNIVFKNGKNHVDYDNIINNGGGAIRITSNSKVNIKNCRFESNSSQDRGGAIQNLGKLTIYDSLFRLSDAKRFGGCIFNRGILDITLSKFCESSSENGGVICNDSLSDEIQGRLAVAKSAFSNSRATLGGALYNNGDVSLLENTFEKSTSKTYGGAIHNLKTVKIDNSEFMENSAESRGGAINNEGDLSIDKATFISNSSNSGGAILTQSDATVSNSKFSNNSSEWGSAIHNKGILVLNSNHFEKNTATQHGGAMVNHMECASNSDIFLHNEGNWGGAIYNYEASLKLENSKFIENNANAGGALHNIYSKSTIHNATFERNTSSENGGAIYNYGAPKSVSQIEMEGIMFIENTSDASGGAIYNDKNSEIIAKRLEISKNRANGDGGAINSEGRFMILEASFLNNFSDEEGGAINNWGEMACKDVTFENNTSNIFGGAINNQLGSSIHLENSKFYNNSADDGGAIYGDENTKTIIDCEFKDNNPNDFD